MTWFFRESLYMKGYVIRKNMITNRQTPHMAGPLYTCGERMFRMPLTLNRLNRMLEIQEMRMQTRGWFGGEFTCFFKALVSFLRGIRMHRDVSSF